MVGDKTDTFVDVIMTKEFEKWLSQLKDRNARQRIVLKLEKLKKDRFITGDWKRIEGAHGIFELRFTFGEGYRVYLSQELNQILLIIAGSSKADQRRVIRKTIRILTKWRNSK